MDVNLENLLRVIEPIERILRPTFGPSGGDVLVESATGGIVTVSDGATVLTSLVLSHPFAKLLVDTALKRRRLFGDGATGFILMVAAALRELKRPHENNSKVQLTHLSRCLGNFRRTMLPQVILHEFVSVARTVGFAMPLQDEFWKGVRAITTACLCGKFSGSTCLKLEEIVVLGLRAMQLCHAFDIVASLHDLLARFRSDICLEVVGMAFSESVVLPGTLLLTEGLAAEACMKLFAKGESISAWVLPVCGEFYEKCKIPTSVTLSSATDGLQLLNWQQNRAVRLAERLQSVFGDKMAEPCLVICSAASIPENVFSECASKGILLLSCLSNNELGRLAHQWRTPLGSWQELLASSPSEEQPICLLDDVKHCLYGGRCYLLLPSTASSAASQRCHHEDTLPCSVQIVICSASATLCRLYSSSVLSCFQTLLYWCKWPSKNIFGLSANCLEKVNHKALYQTENGDNAKTIEKMQMQVIAGKQEEEIRAGLVFSETRGCPQLLTLPAGGSAEMIIYAILNKMKRNLKEYIDRRACEVLAAAVLATPRTLHLNSVDRKPSNFLIRLQEFEQLWCERGAIGSIDPWTGKLIEQAESVAATPLMASFHLICDVCSLLEQLLRIDTVVAVAKK